ncbi:MAG TPA: NifU family protein [Ktedonobacteraceae bacterium]|nr:NifU family protein [Ktedonobacteraceae bacterium]
MQQDLQEHEERAARIETLLQEVASFPDAQARATTEELIQALLDMYGEGLARILALTEQLVARDTGLIEALADDTLVASLLMLHDLHPRSLETRIAQALVEVRPYLKSHGGNVEFVRLEDGIAYLRLEGSCHGCGASTITLKTTIEEAIYKAAPDLDGVALEDLSEVASVQSKPMMFIPRRRKDSKEGLNGQSGQIAVHPTSNGLSAPTR